MEGVPAYNPFTEQTAGEYFVGREEQLRRFEMSLDGLEAGRPQHLFVAGLHGTGKTSYLDRLTGMARERDFVAALVALDEPRDASQHVATLLRALAQGIERRASERGASLHLVDDWDQGPQSKLFRQCRTDQIRSEFIRSDLDRLISLAGDYGAPGLVVCLDEGQRLHPTALSGLKNAVQGASALLVALSLRLSTAESGVVAAGRAALDAKATEAEGDIGASRLFVTGIPMGPFDSDEEAKRCIHRRLRDNPVQFTDKVTMKIVAIAGRVPHQIINYASGLYDLAIDHGVTEADEDLLDQLFRERHRVELEDALDLVADLSGPARAALRALVACGGRATIAEVARKQFANVPQDALATIEQGVAADLDSFCRRAAYCVRADEGYELQGPVYTYALRLALNTV